MLSLEEFKYFLFSWFVAFICLCLYINAYGGVPVSWTTLGISIIGGFVLAIFEKLGFFKNKHRHF